MKLLLEEDDLKALRTAALTLRATQYNLIERKLGRLYRYYLVLTTDGELALVGPLTSPHAPLTSPGVTWMRLLTIGLDRGQIQIYDEMPICSSGLKDIFLEYLGT